MIHIHERACICNQSSNAFKKSLVLDKKDESLEGICRFCGKVCFNQNSLRNHERLCKNNPQKQESNLAAYQKDIDSGRIVHWAKGQTAETNDSIARSRDNCRLTKSGRDYSGWHHTEETKKRIGEFSSKNLSEGYASGRFTSPVGVGRGKYSYFIVNNKKYTLRSTWEFIYALYLAEQHIEFEFEKVRVPAIRENKYSKTFIADFSYDNTVVEIKGIPSSKDSYLKESFEAAGYEFIELFEKDIMAIKDYLINQGYDVDNMINQIFIKHETKDYFTYVFS